MLVACRLAGLSALEAHYAGVRVGAQFGPTQGSQGIVGNGGYAFRRTQRRCRADPPGKGGFFPKIGLLGITHRPSSPRRFLGQEPALRLAFSAPQSRW